MPTNRGRKPLKLKKPSFKYFGGQTDDVAPGVKKMAEENEWALRWLNSRNLKYFGGQTSNYWKPLKIKKADYAKMGLEGSLATDPEGYIRRGDLVLGFRPKEIHKEHREYLDHLNRSQAAAVETYGVEDMKQAAEPHGINVVSGYEE